MRPAQNVVEQRRTSPHAVSQTLLLTVTEDATLGVAGSVWDGGKELACELVDAARIGNCAGQRVIELGAGPGIAGIAAACNGAQVIVTDLDFCVQLMQENIRHNQALINQSGGSASAMALDWNDPVPASIRDRPFDFVLGADVSYNLEFAFPLLKTIRSLTRAGSNVVFAHKPRNAFAGKAGALDAAGDFPFLAEAGWLDTLELLQRIDTSWPGLYLYHFRVRLWQGKQTGGGGGSQ